jgi:hypothetical protein
MRRSLPALPALLASSLRGGAATRATRSLSSAAGAEPGVRAADPLSVRARLKRTPVHDHVLARIRGLQLSRERGGAVRLSEEQLRAGRRRELGRVGLVKASQTAEDLPKPSTAELAIAGRSNVGKSPPKFHGGRPPHHARAAPRTRSIRG